MPYMEKTPTGHVGRMVNGSSVQRTKRSGTEKNKFFSENFLFSITTVYFWGNERRLEKNG